MAPRRMLAAGLSTIALSGCSAQPAEVPGWSSQGITAAVPDDAEGPVVWIVAEVGGRRGFCSGVVVSPHVVMTAAHCSSVAATYSIFLGSDYTDDKAKAKPENHVAITEHRPHPKAEPENGLHDVGVLVAAAPIPRAPATLNREALAQSDVGRSIRIVGFGQVAGDDEKVGRRYAANTTLAAFDASTLTITGTPNFCYFDSGGPTFMKRGDSDVVVGIHSTMNSASCDGNGWDVRVDGYVEFIDQAIAAFDPEPQPQPDPDTADASEGVPAVPPAADPPGRSSSGCSTHPSTRDWGSGALLVFMGIVAAATRCRVLRRPAAGQVATRFRERATKNRAFSRFRPGHDPCSPANGSTTGPS